MLIAKIVVCVLMCIIFLAHLAAWILNMIFSDVELKGFENDEGYY